MNNIINMTMDVNLKTGVLTFLPETFCIWRDSEGKLKSFVGSMIYARYDAISGQDFINEVSDIKNLVKVSDIKNLVNDIVSGCYTKEELLDILPAIIVDDNGNEPDAYDRCLKLRDIDDIDVREGIVKGIYKAIIDNMI